MNEITPPKSILVEFGNLEPKDLNEALHFFKNFVNWLSSCYSLSINRYINQINRENIEVEFKDDFLKKV